MDNKRDGPENQKKKYEKSIPKFNRLLYIDTTP